MGFTLAGLLCACGAAVVALLVAGALLRLAVAVTNGLVRPAATPAAGGWLDVRQWDWDDWDDEPPPPPEPREGTIPDPGTGKSVAGLFLAAIAGAVGFLALGFLADGLGFRMGRDDTQTAILVLAVPVAGLVLAAILRSWLPTTFWRAAMVVFVYGVVLAVFGAMAGLVTLGFLSLAG